MKKHRPLNSTLSSLKTKQIVKTDQDILTPAEAAEFLKISTKTLWRMSKNDEIPNKKVRGQRRYSKSSLTRWLQGDLYD